MDRPLAGRTVAITRPADRAGGMESRLAAAGAEVVVAPAIEVVPAADPGPLDAALRAGAFDWIVFTSVNAVVHTFARLEALGLAALPAARSAAIGEATADALRAHGVEPALVPAVATADGLLAAMDVLLPGARILLPRADRGRETFPEGARARGAEVQAPIAYRTLGRPEAAEVLRPRLEARALDALVFASPSAVRAVLTGLGSDGRALLGGVLLAAIGPTTAAALEAEGLEAACPDDVGGDAVVDLVLARLGR